MTKAYRNLFLLQNIWDIWSALLGGTPLKHAHTDVKYTIIKDTQEKRKEETKCSCNTHVQCPCRTLQIY